MPWENRKVIISRGAFERFGGKCMQHIFWQIGSNKILYSSCIRLNLRLHAQMYWEVEWGDGIIQHEMI